MSPATGVGSIRTASRAVVDGHELHTLAGGYSPLRRGRTPRPSEDRLAASRRTVVG